MTRRVLSAERQKSPNPRLVLGLLGGIRLGLGQEDDTFRLENLDFALINGQLRGVNGTISISISTRRHGCRARCGAERFQCAGRLLDASFVPRQPLFGFHLGSQHFLLQLDGPHLEADDTFLAVAVFSCGGRHVGLVQRGFHVCQLGRDVGRVVPELLQPHWVGAQAFCLERGQQLFVVCMELVKERGTGFQIVFQGTHGVLGLGAGGGLGSELAERRVALVGELENLVRERGRAGGFGLDLGLELKNRGRGEVDLGHEVRVGLFQRGDARREVRLVGRERLDLRGERVCFGLVAGNNTRVPGGLVLGVAELLREEEGGGLASGQLFLQRPDLGLFRAELGRERLGLLDKLFLGGAHGCDLSGHGVEIVLGALREPAAVRGAACGGESAAGAETLDLFQGGGELFFQIGLGAENGSPVGLELGAGLLGLFQLHGQVRDLVCEPGLGRADRVEFRLKGGGRGHGGLPLCQRVVEGELECRHRGSVGGRGGPLRAGLGGLDRLELCAEKLDPGLGRGELRGEGHGLCQRLCQLCLVGGGSGRGLVVHGLEDLGLGDVPLVGRADACGLLVELCQADEERSGVCLGLGQLCACSTGFVALGGRPGGQCVVLCLEPLEVGFEACNACADVAHVRPPGCALAGQRVLGLHGLCLELRHGCVVRRHAEEERAAGSTGLVQLGNELVNLVFRLAVVGQLGCVLRPQLGQLCRQLRHLFLRICRRVVRLCQRLVQVLHRLGCCTGWWVRASARRLCLRQRLHHVRQLGLQSCVFFAQRQTSLPLKLVLCNQLFMSHRQFVDRRRQSQQALIPCPGGGKKTSVVRAKGKVGVRVGVRTVTADDDVVRHGGGGGWEKKRERMMWTVDCVCGNGGGGGGGRGRGRRGWSEESPGPAGSADLPESAKRSSL